jgi:hypothetical protein
MSRKKQSALVSVIEFARTAPVELVQEALGLINMELRLRQPAPVAGPKRGKPAGKRPSSTPPVNEATRIV